VRQCWASGHFFNPGVLRTAREYRLTPYDAVYLQTALQQALPLATLDRQLLAAASQAGVKIVS